MIKSADALIACSLVAAAVGTFYGSAFIDSIFDLTGTHTLHSTETELFNLAASIAGLSTGAASLYVGSAMKERGM